MKHLIIVLAITVLATLGLGALLTNASLMPEVASEEGRVVDSLFDLQLWIIAFLFSLIIAIVLYSVVVFRRKPDEPDAEGDHIKGHTGLELAWTIIPLITVIVLATIGAGALADVISPAEDELLVEVTGFQFGWRFDYPDFGITSNNMVLPKDRQVVLELESLDVIHSFWVPEFRVKQDAVPGMTTVLRFTPTELGEYTLRCAELCGLSHAYMLAQVIVVEPAEFEAWVSEEGAAAEGGETAVADEDYLHRSIVDPAAQIVQGYANVMPQVFGDTLSEQEIDGLIAYIRSLGSQ